MKKTNIVIASILFIASFAAAKATPLNFNIYKKHERAKQSLITNKGCGICHVNAAGGGTRNTFGQAFEAAGKKITDQIIADFPNFFTSEGGDEGGGSSKPAKPKSLSGFKWDVSNTDLTDLTASTLSVNLKSKPANLEGDSVDFIILASKAVSKIASFSATKGTINFDESGVGTAVDIDLTPKSSLPRKIQKKLDKNKPVKLKFLVVPLDVNKDKKGNPKKLRKESSKQLIEMTAEVEPVVEEPAE